LVKKLVHRNFERRLQPIGTRVVCTYLGGPGIIFIALFLCKLHSKPFSPIIEKHGISGPDLATDLAIMLAMDLARFGFCVSFFIGSPILFQIRDRGTAPPYHGGY
jgi:hypothetical protein